MSKPKPKPIRLTKGRALALLTVFEIGANDVAESIRAAIGHVESADEMAALKLRDLELAAARDAAAIVAHRYLGGEAPLTPTPTLF